MYARASEYEYEKPFFVKSQDGPDIPSSTEITIRSGIAHIEIMRTIARTIREISPEFFPQADRLNDGIDEHHYVEPDADMTSEQLNSNPSNPRSTKCDIRPNPKPNFNNGYRY